MQKRYIIGCILLLVLSSCSIFKEKKAPERQRPDREERPVEEEKEEPEEKVEEEKRDTTAVRPEKKKKVPLDKTLNISVFLPFGSASHQIDQQVMENIPKPKEDKPASDTNRWSRNQEAIINFYLGFKLGLEELMSQGVDLEVDVINTSDWTGGTRDFLNDEDISSADVWIGGYDVDQLKTLSSESAARSALFVSPFLTTSYFVENNPYFFQMKPSFERHCRAISETVRELHDPRQVTLVLTDDKKERSKYFRDTSTRGESRQFKTLTFPSHSEIEKWSVEETIQKGDTAVFILPIYRDKGFVYTFLSYLSLGAPAESTIIIYGVPPWDKYELLYEFFTRFTVRMSSSHYEFSANPYRLRSFVEQYVNRFGTMPREESWEGYDLALFLGTAYKQHGMPLAEHVEDLYMQGLSMEFDPEAEEQKKQSIFDFKDRPKYYQNAGVYILEFREDSFRLLSR